jgi:hypothetical protein
VDILKTPVAIMNASLVFQAPPKSPLRVVDKKEKKKKRGTKT